MFIDEAKIEVRSGKGGPGCISFRREKYVPKGGPDGGTGGRGGHVILRADKAVTTLLDVGRRPHYIAENGRQGMGNNCSGRQGRDLVVRVPVGTTVREVVGDGDPREGILLGDLTEHDFELNVAEGGKGGRGNKNFAGPQRQVPRYAQKGIPGEVRKLYLELKLMADVGLVGLPNAGKSTLLSRISAARPKIADYPFTTLKPNLGIVELGDFTRLVFADIPGLIEGAHEGQGLGIEFLRHIERTRVIIHMLSVDERDPEALLANYRMIESELSIYSEILCNKPRIVSLSKIDFLPEEEVEALRQSLSDTLGVHVYAISSVANLGLSPLLSATKALVDATSETGAGYMDSDPLPEN